ncbi:hypothetical protein Taro_002902 [Colocasia esculenta]|uniref:Uncharacterized protein n=1 Tax=Colocasia esculenta TaxID=4460 RepID=A0A843TKJ4_COLES|nr:hypothetical protein [Colocasia esculenta]
MFCRCAASLHDSCACYRLQLLLCRVRGECGRSACSCRSSAVGTGLTGSGLSCVEDACESVQVWFSWSSSTHLSMCVSRRLREPACGVAFTGAGLLPVEPVEGLFLARFCCCRATSESEVRCWFGWCVLVFFPGTMPWWFWWRFSPRLLRVVLVVVALSLSVEMSCRCYRLDCLCYSLLEHCRSRCRALGYVSGCRIDQLVLLVISKFLGRAGGTCVSPWLEWFASFLAPDVLSQMVVW